MAEKTKTSKATVLKALAKVAFVEAPYFAARRAANLWRGKAALQRTGSTIVIDLDETLSKVNSIEELLKMKLGEGDGAQRYQYYRNLVKTGQCTLEEAVLKGYQELMRLGVKTHDYELLFDRLEREGRIRGDVVELANYLQRHGRKVILATKSPQGLADIIARRYRFDAAIGSREKIENGKVAGLLEMIGDKMGTISGHRVATKMDRLREHFASTGRKFDPRSVSVLSDGYDDVEIFKRAGLSVLLAPKNASTPQKIASMFRLRDVEVKEGPLMAQELKLRLRYPWTVKASQARIKQAAGRLASIREERKAREN